MLGLSEFVFSRHDSAACMLTAASVFSGAGLSDLGYEVSGFRLLAQAELEPRRAAVGSYNFPASRWVVGDIRSRMDEYCDAITSAVGSGLDLLSLTPPCQGLSSSNPTRGRRRTQDESRNRDRNLLLLSAVPLIARLRPKVFVCENVRQILSLVVDTNGEGMVDVLRSRLPDYEVFAGVVNMADYGIPQARVRAIIAGVRRDLGCVEWLRRAGVAPWPKPTHGVIDGNAPWMSVGEWLRSAGYSKLDASSDALAIGKHPLHRVPVYERDRYLQVASIPARSGRSAYENDVCPSCSGSPVPMGRAYCTFCRRPMRNRPYVMRNGGFRLVRGFHSSYRRMRSDQPAPPVMTSSGRVGSDYKIHPWENRVMSILECSDLQSVPRHFDWSTAIAARRFGLIREVIGEALPPFFTYCHGLVIARLLADDSSVTEVCDSHMVKATAPVKRSTVSRSRPLTGRGVQRRRSL